VTPRDSLTDSTAKLDETPRSTSPLLGHDTNISFIKNTSPVRNGGVTDLSVKSVLLSEFTSSEKLKYIERSNLKPSKPPLVLNRQEFCINI